MYYTYDIPTIAGQSKPDVCIIVFIDQV